MFKWQDVIVFTKFPLYSHHKVPDPISLGHTRQYFRTSGTLSPRMRAFGTSEQKFMQRHVKRSSKQNSQRLPSYSINFWPNIFIICIIILVFYFCQRSSYLSTDYVDEISGFRQGVNEKFILPGCYATLISNLLPAFRDNVLAPIFKGHAVCSTLHVAWHPRTAYTLNFSGVTSDFRIYAMSV
jgi:hypothetical protein